MNLGEIWEELEHVTPPGERGRVKRRIRPEAKCDLFLAIAKPSNHRVVLMLVGEESLSGVDELPTARGVEARIDRPGEDGADAALELVLTDPELEVMRGVGGSSPAIDSCTRSHGGEEMVAKQPQLGIETALPLRGQALSTGLFQEPLPPPETPDKRGDCRGLV